MKKNNLILFIYFLLSAFSLQSKSNNFRIDSLQNLLKIVNEDTNRIAILNSLCKEYLMIGKFDEAEKKILIALKLSDSLSYLKGQITCTSNLGNIRDYTGDYDKALNLYFKTLKLCEVYALKYPDNLSNKSIIADTYGNIGIIHRNKGDYDKSLEFDLIALKIREQIKDRKGMATSYNNIGNLYTVKKDYETALEFHLKSLKIREELGDKKRLTSSYNNIGIIYYYKHNFPKALEYYLKALKLREGIGDTQGIADSYQSIGIVYYEERSYPEALDYLSKALNIYQVSKNKQRLALTLNNIGEIYLKQKKTSFAREKLLSALNIEIEIGDKTLIFSTYLALSLCDSMDGNFKDAFHYHKLFVEIKDSVFNEKSSGQIAEMQTKYETEKKELQIENLNKDNAIKETEIKKQNVQKLAFASGFGLMLILAFVIFRGYKQKQKANEIITAQKTEVEKQKEIVDEKNSSLEVAYKHIEEKNTEILDSIRYAKRIQEAILPPQKLVKQYLEESFILYKPKDIVAGDFYWVAPLPPQGGNIKAPAGGIVQGQLPDIHRDGGAVLFACCDCTGHGVPGAFVSILGYNGLNRCVKEFGLTKPSEILDKLCELVDEAFSKSESDIKDGMDIALCNLSITNPERVQNPFGVIQYAGAGNYLYHIRNGALTEYSPDKQPIGKFAYRKPFTNHEIPLLKGDSIYIFTDGYADQFGGPKGKKFKYSQFEKLLVSIQEKSMMEQREILNNTIDTWRGELEQIDDICVLGVRI